MAEPVIRGFTWTVGIAGVVWGTIYVLVGAPTAAAFPYGFSIASMANSLAFRRHCRLRAFGVVEIVLVLIVPIALSIHLGGFMASGAVALWSLLAPIGALLVLGPEWAALTFALFVACIALSVWSHGLPFRTVALEPRMVDLFAFLNVVAVSLVAHWATHIFLAVNHRLVREQERLLEVERAYVAQEAMLRQQERLATLGRLSAGVAHELNNPAAAAGRAVGQLAEVIERLMGHVATMLRIGMNPDALAALRVEHESAGGEGPIERGDREERVALWLQDAGAEDAWELAPDLADLAFDVAALDAAGGRYGREAVVAALQWSADEWRARGLLREVHTSAGRISEIVRALKGYSHMDRAESATVDVDRGLDETLLILKAKLAGLDVVRERGAEVPAVGGHAGELNQVWTNLIANAAEAMAGSGTLEIRTRAEGGMVVVEVADDGPGIPPGLIDRVFDPFVTTKAPGEGTGLGLNICHQIVVERHHGTISVDSEPGRTRFVVRLPIEHPAHEDSP